MSSLKPTKFYSANLIYRKIYIIYIIYTHKLYNDCVGVHAWI